MGFEKRRWRSAFTREEEDGALKSTFGPFRTWLQYWEREWPWSRNFVSYRRFVAFEGRTAFSPQGGTVLRIAAEGHAFSRRAIHSGLTQRLAHCVTFVFVCRRRFYRPRNSALARDAAYIT